MTTKFWQAVKQPHPAALPNLQKMSSYMTEQGYTNPNRVVSAYTLSAATNISYNQMLNLIKKPGFVRVFNEEGRPIGYYYAVAELGAPYPERFAPSAQIPHTINQEPTHHEPAGSTEVSRAQASGKATVRDVLDFSNVKLAETLTLKPVELKQTLLNAMIAAAQKKRTPEQIAALTYAMAEKFRDGKFTLTEE